MDDGSDDLDGIDLAVEELEPEAGDNAVEFEDTDEEEAAGSFSHIAPPDRRLITQPYDLSVRELVAQVEADPPLLHVSPVYQRRYVWDNKKASKLVESLLINVPIPVAYLAEERDGSRSVIDGQQRIRSLARFLGDGFPLRGLEVLAELNGKRYSQLPERQQRLVGNRTIRCIVISEDSDRDIRFDVFERLNTGSVALNAQELRNSVYRGPFNELLRELAASDSLRRCVGGREDKRMAFEELVLRFFALHDGIDAYRPSLKRFLSNYMARHQDAAQSQIDDFRAMFEEAAAKAHAVFGEYAFRRADPSGDGAGSGWLSNINSAVFDAVMLNFSRCSQTPEQFAEARESILGLTRELMEDEVFKDAISRATGDRSRVHRRVGKFAEGLASIGFESGLARLLLLPEDPS